MIIQKCILTILFLCFSLTAFAQKVQTLDNALQDCAKYLHKQIPKGTRVALVTIQSENQEIGEFVREKLSGILVNGKHLTVVERNANALKSIEQEIIRHMSGYVSQETEISIGKQLGAQIILSGSITRTGQNWKLDIKALWVETAKLAGQWSAANIRPDSAWATLASVRNASISFGGDSLTARSKQTITTGLQNASKTFSTPLDINESANASHSFTINVYYEQVNIAGSALIKAEAVVAFSQGKRVLCQTVTYYITETTEAMLARRIAERLQSDRAFFNKVNESLK